MRNCPPFWIPPNIHAQCSSFFSSFLFFLPYHAIRFSIILSSCWSLLEKIGGIVSQNWTRTGLHFLNDLQKVAGTFLECLEGHLHRFWPCDWGRISLAVDVNSKNTNTELSGPDMHMHVCSPGIILGLMRFHYCHFTARQLRGQFPSLTAVYRIPLGHPGRKSERKRRTVGKHYSTYRGWARSNCSLESFLTHQCPAILHGLWIWEWKGWLWKRAETTVVMRWGGIS
jgi:hypothetical protein